MDKGLRLIASLALAVTFVRLITSDVVTSSMKIRRMVTEEKNLLLKLKSFIDNQIESIKNMSQFYADRRLELLLENATTNMTDLEHPNTIYHVIKKFVYQYGKALNENYDFFLKTIQKSTDVYLSEQPEINEASIALLRLQIVYNLSVTDMVDGDYLGYKGPALTSVDAVELAVFALSAKDYLTSLDWLNASITKHSDMTYTQTLLIEVPTIAVLKAIMGLVYLRIGKIDEAKHLYNESKMLDPKSFSLAELEQQLLNPPDVEPVIERKLTLSNYSRLCRLRHQQFHQAPNDVRLVCRYRETLLPYYRFQEELLSISPFVSLIYKFTTDTESEFFQTAVQNKLKKVEEPDSADDSFITETRTGQVAYVEENSSETARRLVHKIAHVTYLETSFQNGKKAVDSLQVVNYGLAGHFKVHNDSALETLHSMLTFLIYLSDVKMGGATVFPQLGLSVTPVKNMALMWYNFNTSHQYETMTSHAACPVLRGHKWILTKLIKNQPNIFRRRCGLQPNVSQLEIEEDMKRRYRI